MTDRTPTTAAGRAAMRGIIGGSLALWRDEPDAIADLILAIEAEADDQAYERGRAEGLAAGLRDANERVAEARAPLDEHRGLTVDEWAVHLRSCSGCAARWAALEEPTDD